MGSLYLWCTIAFGFVFLTDAATIPETSPCLYNGIKCPLYDVVSTHQGYELRHYHAASWIATHVTVTNYTKDVSRAMYFRLRNYILGENAGGQRLEMTTPVLTERNNKDTNGMITYTKYFFLADTNAPEPTIGSNVDKISIPAFMVYVRMYGGKPNYTEKEVQLLNLKNSLGEDNLVFNHDRAFFAGYNPPWVKQNRRNEVWLEAFPPV
ncbi:heme-binding protein 2-like [Argopecten irradians]|uniref:heme-binding protein 2-like n=1 Tax=Argopecten irradians TaxID=31199 RepID=UPI003719FAB5